MDDAELKLSPEARRILADRQRSALAKADAILARPEPSEAVVGIGDVVTYTMVGARGVVIEGPEPVFKVQWPDGSTSWVRETQLLLTGETDRAAIAAYEAERLT